MLADHRKEFTIFWGSEAVRLKMSCKLLNSSLTTVLLLFLNLCGLSLSETEILLDGPEDAWFMDKGTASLQIGNWFPYGVDQYSVCDTAAIEREPTNWLRSDFIKNNDAKRVDINIEYTVRKCKSSQKYCKESFKLYVYHSNTDSKPEPQKVNYDKIAEAKPTVIPDRPTGPADVNVMNVSITTKAKGIYLAFYDQGACLSLLKVLVTFNYCPEKGEDLVTFVRTVSPIDDSSPNQVEGKCVDPHSKNTTALTASCTSTGKWNMNESVRCLCKPGYGYSETPTKLCTGCVSGKYKSEMNNTVCKTCPENSLPNAGRTACRCNTNYYRLSQHLNAVPCSALPDSPLFANTTVWNTTSLLITWPPVNDKNYPTITYSIDCYVCKDDKDLNCVEPCGKDVVYHPSQDGLKSPRVSVAGLMPGTKFMFKVYGVTKLNSAAGRKEWKHRTTYGKTMKGPTDPGGSGGETAAQIKKLALTVGLPLVAFLLLVIVGCAVFMCRRNRKFTRIPRRDNIESHELPVCGQKVYIDPTNYDNPEEALRNFAKELDKCSITLEKVIGGGEFGDVYKGILIRKGEDPLSVAVKTLKQGSSKKNRDDFLLEASVMGQFCDPNVIYLEGVVTKSHPLMIVTEFMSNGSLDNFLKAMDSKLSVLQMLGMARGVSSGMTFLAEMNFVHRDLAARNILVSENLVCKVADFGLSRELEDSAYETKGGKIPVRWTAPEAIKYRKFSNSSDVWSYGILLWEIMSFAERPYWDWSNFEVMDRVEGGFRLPPPMHCPTAVHQIMLKCWDADRTKRPKFQGIVKLLDILIRSPEKLRENLPLMPNKPDIDYTCVTTIDEWLNSIKMGQYADKFVTAGYSNLKHLADFEEPNLEDLGIKLIGHKNKIRKSIRDVKTKLHRESSVPV